MPKKKLLLLIDSLLLEQKICGKRHKEENEEAITKHWIKTQGSDLYQDKPNPETPSIYRWALQRYADIFKYAIFFASWLCYLTL